MKVIGIDLGTTTSEVAYYKNGSAEIIKNIREGESTIVPSVVLIEGRKITVGTKAKNQSVLKPRNTVVEIKRLMGTESLIEIDDKKYSPIEISSMILKEIKEMAEFYLGENITEAVITVPANFNDKARRATKEAGKLAGLNVERIINEPTAAAIAYGINKIEDNINILVYDFGGGTIDVTVLELFEGVLDIKASRGNNIGGKDIDEVIGKFIVDEFHKKNKIKLDLKSPRILSVIKSVSEECKKNLSFQKEWQVIVPYITKSESGDPIDLDITVTQDNIKELASNIIKSTENIIDRTLEGSKLRAEDINKVVLVGGSTRMPLVREMIKAKFGVAKIAMGINQEEVVAIGAAIQVGIKNNTSDDKRIVVVDTCSHTLGVEVFGNKLDPIVLIDSKLPAKVTKRYRTVEDNQNEAIINIYEGEHDDVEKNILLDSLIIRDIPLSSKGNEFIDITFEYDLNGILDVKVEVISTGNIDKKSIGNINENLKNDNRVFEESHIGTNDIIIEHQEEHEIFKVDNEVVEEKEVTLCNDEIKIEHSTLKDSGDVEEDVDEDEDYSNIYNEVVSVVNYVNANLEQCSDEIQKEVREMYQDLLATVKNEDFKKCRDIENKILEKMGLQ